MVLDIDSTVQVVEKLMPLFLVVGNDFAAWYVRVRLPGIISGPVVVPADAIESLAECGVTMLTRSVDIVRYYSIYDEVFRIHWLGIDFVVANGVVKRLIDCFDVFTPFNWVVVAGEWF